MNISRLSLIFPYRASIAVATAYIMSRSIEQMGAQGFSLSITIMTASSLSGSMLWRYLARRLDVTKIYLISQLLVFTSIFAGRVEARYAVLPQAASVGFASTVGYYAIMDQLERGDVGHLEGAGSWGWLFGLLMASMLSAQENRIQMSSLAVTGTSILWALLIRDVRAALLPSGRDICRSLISRVSGVSNLRIRLAVKLVEVASRIRPLGTAPFIFRRYSLRLDLEDPRLHGYVFALFLALGMAYPEYLVATISLTGVSITAMLVVSWGVTAIVSPFVKPRWGLLRGAVASRIFLYAALALLSAMEVRLWWPFALAIATFNGFSWAVILVTLNWKALRLGTGQLSVNNTFRTLGYLFGNLIVALAFGQQMLYAPMLIASGILSALTLIDGYPRVTYSAKRTLNRLSFTPR